MVVTMFESAQWCDSYVRVTDMRTGSSPKNGQV